MGTQDDHGREARPGQGTRQRHLARLFIVVAAIGIWLAPPVAAQTTPGLEIQATSRTTLGEPISATATLSAGNDPTGRIFFRAYGPDDPTCTTKLFFVSGGDVFGNNVYGSSGFVPEAAGTWRWVVEYSGDAKNNRVLTDCDDPNAVSVVEEPISDQDEPGFAISPATGPPGTAISVRSIQPCPAPVTSATAVQVDLESIGERSTNLASETVSPREDGSWSAMVTVPAGVAVGDVLRVDASCMEAGDPNDVPRLTKSYSPFPTFTVTATPARPPQGRQGGSPAGAGPAGGSSISGDPVSLPSPVVVPTPRRGLVRTGQNTAPLVALAALAVVAGALGVHWSGLRRAG